MKVIASAAISLDGYLDDSSDTRLRLSSEEDWNDVLRIRAGCDAILVGAGTLRADNPSLVIKDEKLRKERVAAGRDPDIIKVSLSRSGNIDPSMRFFTEGGGEKIIFIGNDASRESASRLSGVATIVRGDVSAREICRYLASMGCERLMVEGGSEILTMFFSEDMVDELRLAVAPFFVGEKNAPRFGGDGGFSAGSGHRMTLDKVRMLGDTAVMDYTTQRGTDNKFLEQAIEESLKCTPSDSAYSVGAVIVTAKGEVYKGYTGETGAHNHAEEEAIRKALYAGASLQGASIYSSMEPCSIRKSKPVPCTRLIIEHDFSRVVFAYREPDYFVDCDGAEILKQAGVEVIELEGYAPRVISVNSHIIRK